MKKETKMIERNTTKAFSLKSFCPLSDGAEKLGILSHLNVPWIFPYQFRDLISRWETS